jgi:hypothetical protein
MPKNMFTARVDMVPGLFLTTGLLNRVNSTTNSRGDNLAVYTRFLISQVTTFNQLNGRDLRRES